VNGHAPEVGKETRQGELLQPSEHSLRLMAINAAKQQLFVIVLIQLVAGGPVADLVIILAYLEFRWWLGLGLALGSRCFTRTDDEVWAHYESQEEVALMGG